MNIIGVRFVQAIHLGRSLDIHSYLEQGTPVLGDPVTLSLHDANFLKVRFKSGYSQLVPMAQVASLFVSETEPGHSSKSRS